MSFSSYHIAVPTELFSLKYFHCNIKQYEGTGFLVTIAWLVIELERPVPDVDDNFENVE
jgi:hypothetical protein